MTSHELARKLLSFPDVPVLERVESEVTRTGDYRTVDNDDVTFIRAHSVSYKGFNSGETGMYQDGPAFDAVAFEN